MTGSASLDLWVLNEDSGNTLPPQLRRTVAYSDKRRTLPRTQPASRRTLKVPPPSGRMDDRMGEKMKMEPGGTYVRLSPGRSRDAAEPAVLVPKAALYLRVSTEDQDLAGQERDLRIECARRNWDVAAIYSEKVSGTGRVERKEYERLVMDARKSARPWDHLLVWSLDRWSREERFSRAVGTIEELEASGIQFHSLREPMLDSTEDGIPNMGRDLLRAILPVIASFESRRKSERVRVAMREIREGRRQTRSGRPPGRPRRVTPEKAARLIELRRIGLKWREVAGRVGLPAGTCAAVWSKTRRIQASAGSADRSIPQSE
jgi:DNA invertase Pin-like site-specific DNA recombinase